jgi:serine/threonine-protein kinase
MCVCVDATPTAKKAPHRAVTTISGTGNALFQDGPAATATFKNPRGIVVLADGTHIVADTNNHRIRRFNGNTGEYTTIAGTGVAGSADGPADRATFNSPMGVTLDTDGNVIIADSGNRRIRCFHVATSNVTTLAGTGSAGFSDGPADRAVFSVPTSVAMYNGNVVIADRDNHRIRLLDLVKKAVRGTTPYTVNVVRV